MSATALAAPAALLRAGRGTPAAPLRRAPAPHRAAVRARAAAPRADSAAPPAAPARVNALAAAASAVATHAALAATAFAATPLIVQIADGAEETPLGPADYALMVLPLVAYGIFYAWRDKNDPRVRRAAPPAAAPAPPPPAPVAVKAVPAPPPAPPAYTGAVTRPKSGRDAFDLTCKLVAEVLEVDASNFTDKTRLQRDHNLSNEDAADITRFLAERGGIAWQDADRQTMRMALLQLSLLEISHIVADRAGVPRLNEWPSSGQIGGGDAEFV